jgi:hypothetical protein
VQAKVVDGCHGLARRAFVVEASGGPFAVKAGGGG